MKQLLLGILLASMPLINALASASPELPDQDILAGRGCCSWHQGVCGCAGGRAQCCDGSLSPSCGCLAPTPIEGAAACETNTHAIKVWQENKSSSFQPKAIH